ncbi:MAG: ROK family protein [Spirochaetales bacterium]|nr:ROK family protein [Spirochaetales bacterium]
MKKTYGLVEAGGTKFVCAVASSPEDLREEVRFPTTEPAETLGRVVEYFQAAQKKWGRLEGLGIGCFGPVDLDKNSPTWGFVTATPKAGWADTNVAGFLSHSLELPVVFDTDVNGAALGEHLWGAGAGLDNLVYLTVGTGIGGGVLSGGRLVHGLVHPELGHFLLSKDPQDTFTGSCPYHGSCAEGLASGPSLEKRWGKKAQDLPPEHPAWDLEAAYLAQALLAFMTCFSPQKIILGGGVMEQLQLFPKIHKEVLRLNNGYIRSPSLTPQGIVNYIVPPSLGNRAGILGALALTST